MVKEAEIVFVEMDEQSLISWSALLSAFVKNGYANRALEFFLNVLQNDVPLDACSECNNLEFGLQIHGLSVKLGYVQDINSGTDWICFTIGF